MVTSAISLVGILFETLAKSRGTVEQVNKACADKGLPLAFPMDENGSPEIPGNPDYRFEGFGLIVGFPPKLFFFVHYKKGSPEHVDLGRFTVPIGFGKLLDLNRLLGK